MCKAPGWVGVVVELSVQDVFEGHFVCGGLSFVAPHTPNPWGHVELVSKDVGIG